MSTRRGGERPNKNRDEDEPKPEPKRKAPAPAPAESKPAPERPASGAGGSSSAAEAPAPAPSKPAPSKKAKEEPAAKRPRVDAVEQPGASWGADNPAPIGVVPQPLLPMRIVAGTGDPGFLDAPASMARFRGPTGLALGGDGCLYVADADNRRLRKIFRRSAVTGSVGGGASGGAAGSVEVFDSVTTVAGSGRPGIREGSARGDTVWDPSGMAIDAQGNVLFSDAGSHCIRRLSATGEVTTFAGCGKPGFADGHTTQAAFEHPCALMPPPALFFSAPVSFFPCRAPTR